MTKEFTFEGKRYEVEGDVAVEKEFNCKDCMVLHSPGMKIAEDEQNLILKKYGLIDLNKEQIQGIVELIRYVNKINDEKLQEFIRLLIEGLMIDPDKMDEFDKLVGDLK